jgi:hypothetical protein
VQTCDASQIQTIPNRNNTAVVLQVIISQNPPSPQDGTQVVKLRQTALGTGSNTAGIAQYVRNCLLKSMLMSARLERHLGPDCGCGCGMA